MAAQDNGRITVELPDGASLELPRGTTAGDVAARIGPGLAKAAVAAKVNGTVVELSRPIEEDASIEILTRKSPEALDVLRHSAAHVLATAVRRVRPGSIFRGIVTTTPGKNHHAPVGARVAAHRQQRRVQRDATDTEERGRC